MHAGILSDVESREIKFEVISKTSMIDFKCEPFCDHNGVKSATDKWQRGFKFLESNLKCKNIVYMFNENLLNVDFTQSNDMAAGAGAWTIVNSLVFNRNSIVNHKKKEGSPLHTMMIFDKSECINGKMSINMWWDEDMVNKSFAAVIVRYIKIGMDEN